jgi:hypothetical protein
MRRSTMMVCLVCASTLVRAETPEIRAFVELRAVAPADERAWREGGLGKTRYGEDDDAFGTNAAIAASWQATPALLASASAQFVPDQRHDVEVLEAWLRYRPVSTTPWRWSATGGMFFPPISLENDGVGWTSPWTLTPSAINSWVGEELRVFGGELRVEHRDEQGTWDVRAALFTRNDPAGELLATRGWAMGDLTSGANASVRQPDVHAPRAGAPVPMLFTPFVETDDRLGAYVAIGREAGAHCARLMYYDNRTDPHSEVDYAGRELYGWRTRFWTAGVQHSVGEWTLVGQAMTGTTRIEPAPRLFLDTDFNVGYVLLTRTFDAWQPALRVDMFQARQTMNGAPASLNEHGNAVTAALNWRPHERIRVIGELLRIDSTRDQRRREGHPPRQLDVQAQLAFRVYF